MNNNSLAAIENLRHYFTDEGFNVLCQRFKPQSRPDKMQKATQLLY